MAHDRSTNRLSHVQDVADGGLGYQDLAASCGLASARYGVVMNDAVDLVELSANLLCSAISRRAPTISAARGNAPPRIDSATTVHFTRLRVSAVGATAQTRQTPTRRYLVPSACPKKTQSGLSWALTGRHQPSDTLCALPLSWAEPHEPPLQGSTRGTYPGAAAAHRTIPSTRRHQLFV
jgi:hypothetical protein